MSTSTEAKLPAFIYPSYADAAAKAYEQIRRDEASLRDAAPLYNKLSAFAQRLGLVQEQTFDLFPNGIIYWEIRLRSYDKLEHILADILPFCEDLFQEPGYRSLATYHAQFNCVFYGSAKTLPGHFSLTIHLPYGGCADVAVGWESRTTTTKHPSYLFSSERLENLIRPDRVRALKGKT